MSPIPFAGPLALLLLALAAVPVAAQTATDAEATESYYAFGRSGLRAVLPAGWSGPAAADESRLPAYAAYTFANREAGPLAGAVLRVERIVGLNPLERERWRTGQTPLGYHGARPVGPAAVPLAGARGVAVERGSARGVVAFVQAGQTFWTVSVEAPAAVWAAHEDVLFATMLDLELPEAAGASAAR